MAAGRRLIWLLIAGYGVLAMGVAASFFILRNDQDGTLELAKLLFFLFLGAIALFLVEYLRARLTRVGKHRSDGGQPPAR